MELPAITRARRFAPGRRAALRGVAAGAAVAVLVTTAVSPGTQTLAPSSASARERAIPFTLVGATTVQGTTATGTPAGIVQSPTTLGIADSSLYSLGSDEIAETLDRLAALGVRDIRIAVPWIYIEPSNDRYDWTKLDFVVEQANARTMNVVGVITATPPWAGFPLNGHSDPHEYAEFAGLVAQRYDGALDDGEDATHGKIAAYEIWNEPNGVLFYNPVSAAAYTEMLKAATPVIRAADPDAVVVAGVLGAVRTIPGLSLNPVTFLEQMYSSGAATDCPGGCFDALSFHPYHYTLPFSLGSGEIDSPLNQVAAMRALMTANGDVDGSGADKRIWVTEYGLPTNGIVTEQEQADFIGDFVGAWQDVDAAGPIFIYSTRDSNTGGFDDEENFGIFTSDWGEKKAVQTLRDLYADLEDGVLGDRFKAAPDTTFFEQLLILGRQVISFLLIVPRAVVQLVVSAVRAVVDGIGSLLVGGVPAASAVVDVGSTKEVRMGSMGSVVTAPAPVAEAGVSARPVAAHAHADAVSAPEAAPAAGKRREVGQRPRARAESVPARSDLDGTEGASDPRSRGQQVRGLSDGPRERIPHGSRARSAGAVAIPNR